MSDCANRPVKEHGCADVLVVSPEPWGYVSPAWYARKASAARSLTGSNMMMWASCRLLTLDDAAR
jgi:predicted FMN-binding regulatory protein PaiB